MKQQRVGASVIAIGTILGAANELGRWWRKHFHCDCRFGARREEQAERGASDSCTFDWVMGIAGRQGSRGAWTAYQMTNITQAQTPDATLRYGGGQTAHLASWGLLLSYYLLILCYQLKASSTTKGRAES